MTDRCEPPAELRGVDGLYWLQIRGIKPVAIRWIPESDDEGFWWFGRHNVSPTLMREWGYRYLMPVPSPAELMALIVAARDIEATAFWSRSHEAPRTKLLDALIPFASYPEPQP